MKNHIGKILRYDEINYTKNIERYLPVISAIEKIKEIYEALDPAFKFTNEVWQSISLADISDEKIKEIYEALDPAFKCTGAVWQNISLADISEKYNSLINVQLTQAKFTARALIATIQNEAEKNLQELKAAFENLQKVVQEQSLSTSRTYLIDLSFIIVDNDKILLSPEGIGKIKEIYESKIETPTENEFYNLLINVQTAYKALKDFAVEHTNFQQSDALVGNTVTDLLHENGSGSLDISDNVLAFLK